MATAMPPNRTRLLLVVCWSGERGAAAAARGGRLGGAVESSDE